MKNDPTHPTVMFIVARFCGFVTKKVSGVFLIGFNVCLFVFEGFNIFFSLYVVYCL